MVDPWKGVLGDLPRVPREMGFSSGLPRVGGVNPVKWASVVVGLRLCQPREIGFSDGLPRVGEIPVKWVSVLVCPGLVVSTP